MSIRRYRIWERRMLGTLAIGGGALGIAATLPAIVSSGSIFSVLVALVAVSFYTWSMVVGIKVLERQSMDSKVFATFWLVQAPVFASPILSYQMSSGALFIVTVFHSADGFNFAADFAVLNARYNIGIFGGQSLTVGLNLFALVAFRMARDLSGPEPEGLANTALEPTSRTPFDSKS